VIKFLLALWRLISLWKRVKRIDDEHEQVVGADAVPPLKKRIIVKSKPTPKPKDPLLRQPGETVAEWWERMENRD
jgi:uncharacterized protein YjiS (DUF1127 family)